MGAMTICMFLGISWLADNTNVVYIEHLENQRSVVAQVADTIFNGGFMFYVVQIIEGTTTDEASLRRQLDARLGVIHGLLRRYGDDEAAVMALHPMVAAGAVAGTASSLLLLGPPRLDQSQRRRERPSPRRQHEYVGHVSIICHGQTLDKRKSPP